MAILDISAIKHHLYVILYESNEQDFAIFQSLYPYKSLHPN